MSADLRISLWNVLNIWLWESKNFLYAQNGDPHVVLFAKFLWFKFFKRPVDEIPDNLYQIVPTIKKYFFASSWEEVYDFIEFVVSTPMGEDLQKQFNDVLESELAGYRFVDGVLADVTSEQEVEALQEALADDRFGAVGAHLRRALELLSDRKAPDYRNSIKESVSAVESMAKIIAGQGKATLGDALKVLERSGQLHPALKSGFSSLYGYTSDEGGIRHAMLDESDLAREDAKYFLLSCTSFVNYLKSRI